MKKKPKHIADNVRAQIIVDGQTIKCSSWSMVEEQEDAIGLPKLVETKVHEDGKCTIGPAVDAESN